jgi:hypothetical protein
MLLDQVRQKARLMHRSIRTQRYGYWITRFLRCHKGDGEWRHPATMGTAEVEQFLTALAVQDPDQRRGRKPPAVRREETTLPRCDQPGSAGSRAGGR